MFIIACLLIILGLMPIFYKANHNTKDVKVNTISVERVQA
ncbi:metallophosphoesterase, partial [Bacillus licheniformis]|nr:metallophosphoesterase [Bacillus licheniformis]